METIVRLKVNPNVSIIFTDCFVDYYPETREIVIMNLNEEVQAVYDADVLIGEIVWKW